jgi:hypothetical protein
MTAAPPTPTPRATALLAAVALAAAGPAPAAFAQAAPASPAASAAPAEAAERQDLLELRATTLALIEALVEQGLLPRAKADELIRKAQRAGGTAVAHAAPSPSPSATGGPNDGSGWGQPIAQGSPPPVVRVPYLPESVKQKMKEDIEMDVLATARDENWADPRSLPEWVKRVKVEGDLRVRAEGDYLDNTNTAPELYQLQNLIGATPAWSPDLVNTRHDRQRLTLRARLGVAVDAGNDTTAGVRLSSGAATSPTSESVTMGNDFNRSVVTLDRAYVKWEPRQGWRAIGGRMGVPFYGTDLLWPEDLFVEGVAGQGEFNLARGVYGFSTIGIFPLQELATSTRDKWLYGAQFGVEGALGDHWTLRGAAAIYEFRNIEGIRETELPPVGPFANTGDYFSSQYPASARQHGNTLMALDAPGSNATSATWGLASRFKPFDVTVGLVDHQFAPFDLSATVDYVRNMGFERADILRRFGADAPPELQDLAAMTTGWQTTFGVGRTRMSEVGDWTAFASWRRFERDAWPDAFTDTTWNLGGTNYQGYSLGGAYLFDRRASVGARWTSTRNLDDGTHGSDLSSAKLHVDVLQVETNVKF